MGVQSGAIQRPHTQRNRPKRGGDHALVDWPATHLDRHIQSWTSGIAGRFDRPFRSTGVYAIVSRMVWALVFILALGIGNFALHWAVMDRGERISASVPGLVRRLGGSIALAGEFAVLLSAALLVANGWPQLVWAYLAYSALNAIAAWVMLRG
ncbi:MAG: hypothetical protein AAF127_05445 [Pseudomonadota bacterium]